MSSYREAVHKSRLFGEFDKLAGFENVSAAEITKLQGIVLAAAEQVEPHMDRIQHTFRQYAKHDLQHLLNIADHVYDFLPRTEVDDTEAVAVNAVELTYLWLAILLHDVGMFVSDAETLSLSAKRSSPRHFYQR